MMFFAILVISGGAGLALWPHRRAARIARRIADGDDLYFEEQRTYRERPSLGDPKHIRRTGLFLLACGITLLALGVLR